MVRFAFFALAMSALPAAVNDSSAEAPQAEHELAGVYRCRGVDFSDVSYEGIVRIERHGETYLLSWEVDFSGVGAVSYEGVGIRVGDALSAAWTGQERAGIIAYEIQPGGRLRGTWTVFGNKITRPETLQPAESTASAKAVRSKAS